jgi:transcriptional regulator with XRE-family HTH domain
MPMRGPRRPIDLRVPPCGASARHRVVQAATFSTMTGQNLLGDFLRARRGQLAPQDLGLAVSGTRRVPGLRREEVARLAEVSPDYYVRIEQGRQVPSERVARALARALRLDHIGEAHLFELARFPPESGDCGRSREAADRSLQTLLDQWTTTPAWVSDRLTFCVAANTLATELNPSFRPGCNTLREHLLQEEAKRQIYDNYEDNISAGVASFRARAGGHLSDPGVAAYVQELETASPVFAELWRRQEVRYHATVKPRLNHPVLGAFEFSCESMMVNHTDGYVLTVYSAEPGSETAGKMVKLRALLTQQAEAGSSPKLAKALAHGKARVSAASR